jgi:type III pantothenate kinase
MLLLLDIGNTHTHLGLATGNTVKRQRNIETARWENGSAAAEIERFAGRAKLEGACFCSVVPQASPQCAKFMESKELRFVELNARTVRALDVVGIDYPKPETIGPDRLANAIAVKAFDGCPALVVDFGTAVTFDVVDRDCNYIGGIIAPGLSAMTDYLHEKTALLPRIKIREPRAVVGRNTEQAMLIGAVHGYRGLIRGLIDELKSELKVRRLPVVATGGYATLIASKMPEITTVRPNLTLEGLRLLWLADRDRGGQR